MARHVLVAGEGSVLGARGDVALGDTVDIQIPLSYTPSAVEATARFKRRESDADGSSIATKALGAGITVGGATVTTTLTPTDQASLTGTTVLHWSVRIQEADGAATTIGYGTLQLTRHATRAAGTAFPLPAEPEIPIGDFYLSDYAGDVVINTGVNSATSAWNAALAAIRAQGAGRLWTGAGTFEVDRSIIGTTVSNLIVEGSGEGVTTIVCTDDLDGSDDATRNAVFNFINRTATITGTGPDGNPIYVGDPDDYYSNITFRNLTIDATLQNHDGATLGSGLGLNGAALEFHDCSNVTVENVTIVGAYANGVVFGTIDPGKSAALKTALLRNVTFRNCCRGLLKTYASDGNPEGLAGAVFQFGAAWQVRLEHILIEECGGTIDWFNCDAVTGDDILIQGWNGAPFGPGQVGNILSLHSDFGNTNCALSNVTIKNGGGIGWYGAMTDQFFFNDYTKTEGPRDCRFADVTIEGTATSVANYTQPAAPASGTATQNTSKSPVGVTLTWPSGVTMQTVEILDPSNAVVATHTLNQAGPGSYLFAVPITTSGTFPAQSVVGYKARPTWTGSGSPAPSWVWVKAPNVQRPAITLSGGTVGSDTGLARRNTFEDVRVSNVPAGAVVLSSTRRTAFRRVSIADVGAWSGRPAVNPASAAYGIYVEATSGNANSVSSDNTFEDVEVAGANVRAAYYEAGTQAGGSGNAFSRCTFANGSEGALVMAGTNRPALLLLPSQPSVPSSSSDGTTNAVTNPYDHACFVEVTGNGSVTATDIAVDGAFTGLTFTSATRRVWVGQGGRIALKYTGLATNVTAFRWFRA